MDGQTPDNPAVGDPGRSNWTILLIYSGVGLTVTFVVLAALICSFCACRKHSQALMSRPTSRVVIPPRQAAGTASAGTDIEAPDATPVKKTFREVLLVVQPGEQTGTAVALGATLSTVSLPVLQASLSVRSASIPPAEVSHGTAAMEHLYSPAACRP